MRVQIAELLSKLGIVTGQPQLRAAQLEAIGKKIPLLYLIMAFDALSLARHAAGSVPTWIGVWFPAIFITACLARGIFWMIESRRPVPKPEDVARRFRVSTILGGVVLGVFVGWAIDLYGYASAGQRPALVFDALGMALACTLCVKHYPAAAVLVLGVVVVPFVAMTLASGDPTLTSMAVTSIFVSIVMLYVLIADFRTFRLMVESREGLRERHAQVEKLHMDAVEAEERRQRERREMLGDLAGAFRQSVEEETLALGSVARRSGDQADEVARHSTAALRLLSETSSSAQAVDESSRLVASATVSLCESIASIRQRMGRAVAIANTVERRTTETDRAMIKLGETLRQIETIAHLIKTIAEQIDLIALNATIEAARAGETGRAFAVVAAEIKHLARQTARATTDISRHTGDVNLASVEASGSVSATKESFLELLAVSVDLAAALDEQTKLTSDIGDSVHRSVANSAEMRARLDHLSTSAMQTNRSATSLLDQCGVLGDKSETLTREVGKFVGVLRAA